MSRFGMSAAALAVLFCLAGCATSTLRITPAAGGQLSRNGAPVAYTIEGMNSGVYLFYYIPLWSGNPRRPNRGDYDLFRHRVNDKAIFRMFDVFRDRTGSASVEDVRTDFHSTGVWTLWIFWKRSVHGSGVLVRESADDGGK